eukprot:CAMPEP_0202856900 /NCGR_PEP_ID=MMETSP1391-20130828/26_1 /ASSEMBLY_ACC=CAM_ASM_000867 /TAXON_ID=1034604 /ORGANISM="Chlamydomonas leiostraca, Strain SAG 11-49" /LENGTH=30 /DNA_ID= /DNA_START= /DNA_END= /DNA_ORIENTATION=
MAHGSSKCMFQLRRAWLGDAWLGEVGYTTL